VATEEMTADRSQMGWKIPDFGKARIVISTDEEEIERLVSQGPIEAIHIVAGARWKPLGELVTRQCLRLRRHLGIMSEAADNRGWRGQFRWVKYTAEHLIRGRHFNFILAMGETGVRWFRCCGYPARRIFPFAYFTESPGPSERIYPPPVRQYPVLGYLGRYVPGKGLEALIDAFALCREMRWTLTLVGDGPLRSSLADRIKSYGLGTSVSFLPFMEYPCAMEWLGGVDLLVLPSDGKEGWGAVVNEALMRGVPVICSDHCGAADLLRESWRGAVVRAGSVPALAQTLREWIARGRRTQETSTRIQAWSQCIGGESVARYLEGILDHVYHGAGRPEAPWRLESPS
jgi:glycosyltransferase involved in cell wall biosynthesis